MIKFSKFIKEAFLLHDVGSIDDLHTIKPLLGKNLEQIKNSLHYQENPGNLLKNEPLDDEHSLMHFNTKQGKLYTVMKDGKSTLALTTEKDGASESIDSLGKAKENTYPPHKLYHHLITKHDKILTTSSQSEGGIHVWQQLAKMPGINTHGWDVTKQEAVNTDKLLRNPEETHFDFEEYRKSNNPDYLKDHGDLKSIHLVAHKK